MYFEVQSEKNKWVSATVKAPHAYKYDPTVGSLKFPKLPRSVGISLDSEFPSNPSTSIPVSEKGPAARVRFEAATCDGRHMHADLHCPSRLLTQTG